MIVPVFVDGSVMYVLTTGVFQNSLRQLLERQGFPSSWVVSIFDPKGVIATRTHAPEKFSGRYGSSRLLDAMRQRRNGFVESKTLEGVAVYSAFSRSEKSSWSVAIGIPKSELEGDFYRVLGWSCGGLLVLLVLGLGFAAYHTERILRAVRALVARLMATGDMELRTVPQLQIDELNQIAQAFEKSIHARTLERDEAEREREAAERATRLKDEFIATVSHELRTPLTSITASLALLVGSSDGDPASPARRLIAIALSNSQRLVRLVNDILDIEKLEAGKVNFKSQLINLRLLVQRSIEANRPFAESAKVLLKLNDIGSCEVLADADRLMQILSNLLSNAIKFSPAFSEVTVTIERREEIVRVSVADQGPGIPDEFKSRLFQKFAQADGSDSRKNGGTGLGLSIAKEIVERLGGTIGYVKVPSGGAEFFVELPCANSVGEGKEARRLLLCEDDPEMAAAIAKRLNRDGYSVDLAPTVGDAVARSSARLYAAILVDLQLPDGDGISLIQMLRGLPQHSATPIIVVSANPGRGQDDIRSGSLNVFDWIPKPFDSARLLSMIHQAIEQNECRAFRILHMDANHDVLTAVGEALAKEAVVVSAASAQAAVQALTTGDFDLAVIDLETEGDMGVEVVAQLRDLRGLPIPVILYSSQGANSVNALRIKAALAKSRGSIDLLVQTVKQWVDRPSGSSEPGKKG